MTEPQSDPSRRGASDGGARLVKGGQNQGKTGRRTPQHHVAHGKLRQLLYASTIEIAHLSRTRSPLNHRGTEQGTAGATASMMDREIALVASSPKPMAQAHPGIGVEIVLLSLGGLEMTGTAQGTGTRTDQGTGEEIVRGTNTGIDQQEGAEIGQERKAESRRERSVERILGKDTEHLVETGRETGKENDPRSGCDPALVLGPTHVSAKTTAVAALSYRIDPPRAIANDPALRDAAAKETLAHHHLTNAPNAHPPRRLTAAQPPSKNGGAPTEREKPNFKPTGLLAKEANRVEGTKISLKYHEPPEARKPAPSSLWRLWIFKGDDTLGTIELQTQSCWLLGRAREVADIALEHPSCSQQHAVIQFRYIQKTVEDDFGIRKNTGKVKPYIMDLESSNGTELNGDELDGGRFYELRDKDILRFGGSEREYMIMLPPKE
ncbi:SMAD/FHA domain-containing protein [Sporormia fimetaria CBS 119925]|uniref:SMAD/FHA domain-containing protein n=1 Tax=Sporormia fimetaria CBS 119925 TaxID=1340428 RepID=A0A6A6UY89_9PLEO|nr:SMAD/FHA domain-containing protein [Sporormia fimetaria CBS 119925]